MAVTASSGTPKGTAPLPTRRATKHKRVEYGHVLLIRATARRIRRDTERAAMEKANKVPVDWVAKPSRRDALGYDHDYGQFYPKVKL